MCGDCWNAAMGAPMAVAMGRFAWVGYRDRIPFLPARWRSGVAPTGEAVAQEPEPAGADPGARAADDADAPAPARPPQVPVERSGPSPGALVGPRR
ncbi:hypothetical protein PO878_03150 [Iamia majanohamensis]|uniref:Uncharacterized protein n=1 Tax=Iamia majanohamensis TaxID=467976 RepID=A0AAF0BWE1_9ACTN|nr:hypothetical protein [Iamia majanohamensis]WCO67720.1 hypothetical protein PO878_03150 [Iamia majanohamensis]